jgi:hypothetical protein
MSVGINLSKPQRNFASSRRKGRNPRGVRYSSSRAGSCPASALHHPQAASTRAEIIRPVGSSPSNPIIFIPSSTSRRKYMSSAERDSIRTAEVGLLALLHVCTYYAPAWLHKQAMRGEPESSRRSSSICAEVKTASRTRKVEVIRTEL